MERQTYDMDPLQIRELGTTDASNARCILGPRTGRPYTVPPSLSVSLSLSLSLPPGPVCVCV